MRKVEKKIEKKIKYSHLIQFLRLDRVVRNRIGDLGKSCTDWILDPSVSLMGVVLGVKGEISKKNPLVRFRFGSPAG